MSVAFALNLVLPGLGYIYCGQVRRGLALWFLSGLVVGFFIWTWAQLLFVPWAPALVLVSAWSLMQITLLFERARHVRDHGLRYQLLPVNHWLSYVGIFLGLGVLPAVLGLSWIGERIGSVAVSSDAMFPALLQGDRLLVDRAAFRERAPRVGELVVLDGPGEAAVVRVVATSGHTIHLRNGRPVVDGLRAQLEPLAEIRVARFNRQLTAQLRGLAGYREHNRGEAYVVTYRTDAPRRTDPPPVRLRDEELYVLGDNRDAAFASRAYGRIERADVVGRPHSVWFSVDSAGSQRRGRVGVEVR